MMGSGIVSWYRGGRIAVMLRSSSNCRCTGQYGTLPINIDTVTRRSTYCLQRVGASRGCVPEAVKVMRNDFGSISSQFLYPLSSISTSHILRVHRRTLKRCPADSICFLLCDNVRARSLVSISMLTTSLTLRPPHMMISLQTITSECLDEVQTKYSSSTV